MLCSHLGYNPIVQASLWTILFFSSEDLSQEIRQFIAVLMYGGNKKKNCSDIRACVHFLTNSKVEFFLHFVPIGQIKRLSIYILYIYSEI